MKKSEKLVSVLFILVGCFNLLISARDIARISEYPSGKLPGRIVKLKKVAVAHDDNGYFIFKRPHNILSVEGGSFFLIDRGLALKFGADGKFLKKIVTKGQGPGEATYLNQLYKRGNELIVNTGFMRKLMVFDFDGGMKAEYKEIMKKKTNKMGIGFSETVFNILAHREDGSLLVLKPTIFQTKKEKIKKDGVFLLSGKNEWQDKLFEIPMECIIINIGGGEKLMLEKIALIFACDRQFLYFSNTERYEIKKYNIRNNKIEALLKRKYNPIPIPEELKDKIQYGGVFKSEGRNKKAKTVKPPQPKYFRDINNLFVRESNVWVMTSIFDKEKGILFDVYNQDGEYIDNFYISFPGFFSEADLLNKGIHIFKKFLFNKEIDEEGNYIVVKYEME
jgi:hypothetical protein